MHMVSPFARSSSHCLCCSGCSISSFNVLRSLSTAALYSASFSSDIPRCRMSTKMDSQPSPIGTTRMGSCGQVADRSGRRWPPRIPLQWACPARSHRAPPAGSRPSLWASPRANRHRRDDRNSSAAAHGEHSRAKTNGNDWSLPCSGRQIARRKNRCTTRSMEWLDYHYLLYFQVVDANTESQTASRSLTVGATWRALKSGGKATQRFLERRRRGPSGRRLIRFCN